MPRKPLFVRSARSAPAPSRATRRVATPARIAAATAGVVAFVVLTVAAATLAVEGDGIALMPVRLAPGLAASASGEPTSDLLGRALALRDRARAIDDLAPEARREWPAIAIEAPGFVTAIKRALRRTFAHEPRRITVRIAPAGSDVEITLRHEPGPASVRSRVPHDARSVDAAVDAGAYDLLLLVAPLDAASLALDDPRMQSRAADLAELKAALQRDAAAAADPRALVVSGLHDAATGHCREAIAQFARVIDARPSSPRAFLYAADCHARLGERARALDLLGRVAKRPDNPPFALSLAGQAYDRIGRPQEALALLASAHVRDAKLADNATAIGEVLLSLHRPHEAVAWLTSHPAPQASRERWLAALGLAQARSGAGPAAHATSTALRTLDPANPEATRIDAELAVAAKAWPQALGRFGALRLAAPSDAAASAGEGFALLGLRRFGDAAEAFRHCAKIAPYHADCGRGLAIALREADRTEDALDVLADAERLDPLDPRIPAETAKTLRALLRHDEAAAASARADTLAQKLLQRVALPGP
jgi:tetratricopeptide (TPR) repeat protein